MTDSLKELMIERLGQRGEGIAHGDNGPVYVPYALASEIILAEVAGERGRLIDVLRPSPDRIPPFCRYYGTCGGCAVQALAPEPYAVWKRGLLVAALRHAGINADVAPLVDAHGDGRRRATFHARFGPRGEVRVGFTEARAHHVVDLDACPILASPMAGALSAAHAVAAALRAAQKPLDLSITATRAGLDVEIRGHGPLKPDETANLTKLAQDLDLARLSNDGLPLIELRAPMLRMGQADVAPPPGAFLQATEAGEQALAAKVCSSVAGARRIADLFAGIGTFGLRLAEKAQVHAIDSDEAALAAFTKAACSTPALQPVTTETRDLFRRPFSQEELARFDAVVFDPPRAGAEAQARVLAASLVPTIVAVSCNAQTFSRDAALLMAGGYAIESIMPFDQFRYSAHLECVGVFRRPKKTRHVRRLLG